MSTDLYGIRVLSKEKKEVKFQVFVVYYDIHDLPSENKGFFLGVLWDQADTRFGSGGPLGDEISVNQICDEKFVLNNADKYIESVKLIETKNCPFNPKNNYSTFYYERNGKWKDEEKLIQGIYKVNVFDEKWIQHLEIGMSWGTTFYEI